MKRINLFKSNTHSYLSYSFICYNGTRREYIVIDDSYWIVENISPMSINKEESMEEDTYLQNKYKEIKKWYNSQQELKEK